MAETIYIDMEVGPEDLVFFTEKPEAGWFKVSEVGFEGRAITFKNRWGDNTQTEVSFTAVITPTADPSKAQRVDTRLLNNHHKLETVIRRDIQCFIDMNEQAGTDAQQKRIETRVANYLRLIAELYLIDAALVTGDARAMLAQGPTEVFTAVQMSEF